MNWTAPRVGVDRIGKVLAAVVVGLGLGTLVPPDPLVFPVVGSVPAFLVGGLGLAAGSALYVGIDRRSSSCGCSGDCGCS